MKYWVFQSNQVAGPYHPDDLTQVPGYSGETLVCPEGRRGTNMGDWQRASMVPELSLSIIKAGQLAVALKGSGGYGGLPPEPTLRDLAALGSLQEKVSLLDNTVGHLQESLRLKEEELLSVHQELDDKSKYAQELSVKLGGLEERFAAVGQLREGLDKAVEAEHGVESTVEKQSQLIDDLSSQLRALRQEQKQVEELREELARVKDDQKRAQEETERKLAEARAAAEEADKKAAAAAAAAEEADKKAVEAASKPAAAALMPSPISAPLSAPAPTPTTMPAPAGLKPDSSLAEKLGLPSERPAAAALSLDAPAPLAPMSEGKSFGLGDAKPLEPLGPGATLDVSGAGASLQPLGAGAGLEALQPLGEPAGLGIPAAQAPASAAAPAAAPAEEAKKSNKPLVLVAVAVVAAAGIGAMKLGLIGKHKAAAPDMPAAPVAAVSAPLPPPPPQPPKPTPEELAEQEKQAALSLVKGWPLPDGSAVGGKLEPQAAVPGGLSPWMADGKDGLYQVNFYAPKTETSAAVAYEFSVSLAERKVTAHNKNADALLAGKPVEALKPRRKARMPKIRPKAKKEPAGDDSGLLQDLLGVDDGGNAKKSAKKPAADAGRDGGGDTLVDGSGHDAAPLQAAAKPVRKAPKRVEKRNVDKELNDLLSDDGSGKPAEKAAAPKDESLDELLAPGSAKPADAAPVAEPTEPSDASAQDAAPAPAPKDSAAAPADEPADAQAEAAPPKPTPKAKKRGQAADAELLDDLLK